MKLKPFLFLPLIAVFLVAGSLHAQAWSGILDPSRATDWSKAGVQGGIPNYTKICSTITPSGDATGNTDGTAINNALSSCASSASAASPQVVFLSAGTFYSKIGIGPPAGATYLVLRGAGPDKTILKFVGTSSQCGWSGVDICIGANYGFYDFGGSTAWLGTNNSIGTYTQGASVLDLTSTTGLFAGQLINLTERNDSMGLCPQSGGTGDCASQVGLSASGTTVTAVTSAPYSAITAGAKVYVGTNTNHSVDGSCGGYQSGPTPWTVASATTNSTNTVFTYTDTNTLSTPTSNCEPVYASVDTGGLFTSGVDAGTITASVDSGTTCPSTTSGNQCAAGEYSRSSEDEAHIITAVCTGASAPVAACLAANEVVIEGQVIAPNYRSGQKPSLWWPGGVHTTEYAQYDGLEDLTIDATNDGGAHASVDLSNAENCWVRNIRSIDAHYVHVSLESTAHDSVVDSYFWGTQLGGMDSYGIDLLIDDSSDLIQNNITQHIVSGVIVEESYGSVIAYNYAIDQGTKNFGSLLSMIDLNHGYSGAMLAEGDDSDECNSDVGHGTSWALTFFRNRCRGQDTPAQQSLLYAASDPAFQRAQNWVGNVMGTSGAQLSYDQQAAMPPFPPNAVYVTESSVAYIENGPGQVALNLDPVEHNSLLRWGDYDVITGAVRWCGNSSDPGWTTTCSSASEIPTTGVAYVNGNPVPSSTTLPASFYLSAQPSFWQTKWGTPPWPAIGPDVTGGTAPDGLGGYSYAIPAQQCYNNTPIDPAYQQTFTVTGGSWASGTATLDIGSNTLAAGNTVTVSGINPEQFNGTFQVTGATSSTITYALPSDPSGYVSGGAVTTPNILLFNAIKCYPGESTPDRPSNLTAVVQ